MTLRGALEKLASAGEFECNPSLWADRFQLKHTGEAAGAHLQALCKLQVPDGYARAVHDREQHLRALDGAIERGCTRIFTAQAQGRLVVGLGAASVQETALSWLRPWGVPYIPGSALKGLAAAAAHSHGGDWARGKRPEDLPGRSHGLLFGSVGRAGYVTFHDAWWVPTADQKLEVAMDVMTVHHPGYYTGVAAPTDFDEPNPVSFLTVHGTFLAALTGPGDWVLLAADFLEQGLREEGIGAKTAAGYGRMRWEAKLTDEERQARDAREAHAGRVQALRDRIPHLMAGNARAFVDELDALVELSSAQDPVLIAVAREAVSDPKPFKKLLREPGGQSPGLSLLHEAFSHKQQASPTERDELPAAPVEPGSTTQREVVAEAWHDAGTPNKPWWIRLPGQKEKAWNKAVVHGLADGGPVLSALRAATAMQPQRVWVRLKTDGRRPEVILRLESEAEPG